METIEDDTLDGSPSETHPPPPNLVHLRCEKCGLEVWMRKSDITDDTVCEYGPGTVHANGGLLECPSHGMSTYFLRRCP